MNNGFVFAVNDFFYRGLLVTIKSLLKFNPTAKIEILDTGLSEHHLKELECFSNIRVINIKDKINVNFQNKREWHSDFSVYGSLFIDESSFDNIIFCDSDLLVLSDLSEYFEYIERYKVVATKSNSINSYFNPLEQVALRRYVTEKGQKELNKEYSINWNYVTFNSGFWGIQKAFYKELKQKYWNIFEKYETEFTFHDQTFINLILSIDNICYYDAGIGFNAVNIGQLNMFKNLKTFIKYLFYKISNRSYKIKGSTISYKDIPIKVVHWTGGDKPFFSGHKKFGGGISLWKQFMDN